VTITKQGRDHLVLLSAEEYERLKRQERSVGRAGDISDEMLAAVLAAKAPAEASAFDGEVK
jgi:PHD/YefM family antitoxin component YafN of YafNO toxin-antitoxin module